MNDWKEAGQKTETNVPQNCYSGFDLFYFDLESISRRIDEVRLALKIKGRLQKVTSNKLIFVKQTNLEKVDFDFLKCKT